MTWSAATVATLLRRCAEVLDPVDGKAAAFAVELAEEITPQITTKVQAEMAGITADLVSITASQPKPETHVPSGYSESLSCSFCGTIGFGCCRRCGDVYDAADRLEERLADDGASPHEIRNKVHALWAQRWMR